MALTQSHFRVRPHDGPLLDANGGTDWQAATDVNPTNFNLHERIRIRFAITATAGETEGFQLWYRKNAEAYAVVPDNTHHIEIGAARNEVACLPSDQFTNGQATTAQLISSGTFVQGSGNEDNTAAAVTLATNEVTEIEWCIIIRKLGFDGHLPDDTTIDFRVYRDNGTPLDTYDVTPQLTVQFPDGWIGGCYPEMGGDLGPFLAPNGALYIFCEYAEFTNNTLVMMKSTDGGLTWDAMDEANNPVENDFEGVHGILNGTDLVVFHQGGSAEAWTHTFDTSTDTWGAVDVSIDSALGAKVQSIDTISAVYRSARSDYVVFDHGSSANNGTVWVRSGTPGSWNTRFELDTDTADFLGVTAVMVGNDVHIFYFDNSTGTIWHRMIADTPGPLDGTDLSGRTQIVTSLSTNGGGQFSNPPSVYDDGGTKKIALSWIDNGSPQHCQGVVFTPPSTVGTIQQASDNAVAYVSQADHLGSWLTQTVAHGTDLYTFWIRRISATDATEAKYAISDNGAAYGTPVVFLDVNNVVPHDYATASAQGGAEPGWDAIQAKIIGSDIWFVGSWAYGGQAFYATKLSLSSLDQSRFRWRQDNAAHESAAWEAAENASITLASGVTKRLRVQVDATGNPPSADYRLEYRKQGDTSWETVDNP